MLSRIIQFSLRSRGVIIALACGLLGYGVYTAAQAKLDVFPEFAPPQVIIQTEAPGLSPKEVEALVTRPIENILNGAPDLVAIRSQSIQGLSAITTVFRENADVFHVRQMVSERLTEVTGHLPRGVKPPAMGPLASSTSLMLVVGLTSQERTPMELRTFADWTLRPRMLGVPGVAKVEVFGGEVRQIQIQVQPDRLAAFNLTWDEVLAAARKSTAVLGAGFVENPNQRVILRTEGQAQGPAAIGRVVVAHHAGHSVRLQDVARIVDAPEPKFGDAQIMGEPGVVLQASSQYGANTIEVTTALEQALDEMKTAFASEKITLHPRLFRPANFIEAALHNVKVSLLLGGGLVAVVLFLFLFDLRPAFISFVSIPLSLLAAVIVLDRLGQSINTLTLGGFAIAIGVVVDDAIIDVENILRRLRLNLAADRPRPLVAVILEASLEVRSAVVYATFIVAMVFLPVWTMTGVQGRLFAPLGEAFILAILASLGVALTVTPALAYLFLSRAAPRLEPGYVRWMKERHRRWLTVLSRHPKIVFGAVLVLCGAAAATLPFLGKEFLPEFREGHYIVHLAMTPGASLEESLRIGRLVSLELLKNPHIRVVSQQAGRAENGEDTWGPHYSEMHVDLQPMSGAQSLKVTEEIRATLEGFTGVTFRILPFLVERIEETLSGATAQVVINIFGDDLDELDRKAQEVRQVLAGIPGMRDVQAETQPGIPEVTVHLRPERLIEFGCAPTAVLEAIQTAYQGEEVGQVFEGNRTFGMTVLLDEQSRRDPELIGALLIHNSEGLGLPLRLLADIEEVAGRFGIMHEGAQRRQQVTGNVHGRDIAAVVAEAKRQIGQKVVFPAGTFPVYGGSAEAEAKASRELIAHSSIAGLAIVLLLSMVFARGRNLWLVLANLPFALLGGVLAVFAGGGLLSLGSLVGFVTLFGLTLRNSIMMISHFEHLVDKEGMAWGLETAVRGASERLAPILMTALVTALGLLPLALGSGEAGREIEGPMAMVILGGLVTSTVLNLFVLPILALRYGAMR